MQKFDQLGSVANKKKCRPGNLKLGTAEHAAFVNRCMTEMPDLTAREVAMKIQNEFNVTVSTSTVNRFRQKLGWTQHGTRYCQLIRDVNKDKRVEWCEQMLENDERFDVSIYSVIIYQTKKSLQPFLYIFNYAIHFKPYNFYYMLGTNRKHL